MSTVEFPLPDWRENTITSFPAIADTPAAEPAPCQCGMHDTPAEPGKDCLLSCAPNVVSRMWKTRVANGQWDDIHALWDRAHANTHLPALDEQRRIHSDLAARRYDIAAMLSRTPALHSSPELADGLHRMEQAEPHRLAEVQAWVADRAAEGRRADAERRRAGEAAEETAA